MFIELSDVVQCIHPHESNWLVLSAEEMAGRHVVTGQMGCPVCAATYLIRDGEAHFEADQGGEASGIVLGANPSNAGEPEDASLWEWLGGEEASIGASALLSLVDVRQPVLLAGAWGCLAPTLADTAPAAYVLTDPTHPFAPVREEISVLRTAGALPLRARSLFAAALDGAAVREGLTDGTVRALRHGGRLVAPSWAPLPEGVTELARDDTLWVAERVRAMASGPPVAILRAPPSA